MPEYHYHRHFQAWILCPAPAHSVHFFYAENGEICRDVKPQSSEWRKTCEKLKNHYHISLNTRAVAPYVSTHAPRKSLVWLSKKAVLPQKKEASFFLLHIFPLSHASSFILLHESRTHHVDIYLELYFCSAKVAS